MVKFYDQWRLFEEASHTDLKSLKFGKVTKPKLIKRLSEKPQHIDIDASDIPSGSFPPNDSEGVKKELEHVSQEMTNFDAEGWTKEDMELTDQKPLEIFVNFLKDNGIKPDTDFLSEIYEDVARIVIKLKVSYNRPRPAQLGPLLGFEITALKTTTDKTPSFPSGHTTQAWTMAHHLSSEHPELKAGLFDIARKIERSRLVRGAHFPSDNVFAKFVAKHYLAPNIKNKEKPE